MFFAEFDWGSVARSALIGGVIGGLVGMIAYFFRKPPTKKDETSD